MSPSLIKPATWLLSVVLAAAGGIVIVQALGTLFSGRPFTALLQVAAGVALPLTLWLIVRLLSEILLAHHRMSDRLSVLTEALREKRVPPSATSVRTEPQAAAAIDTPNPEAADADEDA